MVKKINKICNLFYFGNVTFPSYNLTQKSKTIKIKKAKKITIIWLLWWCKLVSDLLILWLFLFKKVLSKYPVEIFLLFAFAPFLRLLALELFGSLCENCIMIFVCATRSCDVAPFIHPLSFCVFLSAKEFLLLLSEAFLCLSRLWNTHRMRGALGSGDRRQKLTKHLWVREVQTRSTSTES